MKPISQVESQKIKFIEAILTVIDENGQLDTSSIKSKSKLSWNSVNRTLKLFREKNIVTITNLRSENNRKIYCLNRDRAIVYLRFLYFWKGLKKHSELWKFFKSDEVIIKYFPEDLIESELKVLDKKSKNGFKTIKIENMPYHEGYDIITDFYLGNYCYNCIHDGWLYKISIESSSRYCEKCGKEQEMESVMMSRKDPTLEFRRKKNVEEEKAYLALLRKKGL